MKDSFLTIKEKTVSEVKIQKSRFIAHSFPVDSLTGIQEILKSVKKDFYDASHHPYAYRLGTDENNFRYSDDGEPTGSSGIPILEIIDKFRLTNVLIAVSRYFGGIKLGVGGLRRAMSEAAELCLNKAEITEELITENVTAEFDYRFMNVIMNLIGTEKIKLLQNNSGGKCKLILQIRLSKTEKIKSEIFQLTNGSAIIF